MYNFYQKYRSIIIILIKLLIVSTAFYFIYQKVLHSGFTSQEGLLQYLKSRFFTNPLIFISVMSFTIANWFFEVLKWKTLVSSVKQISFFEAFKQSASSLTASLLTPNRIGEYGAKAIYYAGYQRKKIMFLNLIGNLSQMLMTMLFGIVGFVIMFKHLHFTIDLQPQSAYLIIGFTFLVCLLLYRFRNYFWNTFALKGIEYFRAIPKKDQKDSLKFSLFRYLIFSHQFYFLLLLFGVEMDYLTAMGAIFSMYFIASVIPGFVVFDFIVKGSIAISVFGLLGVPEMIVLSIATMMWLLNFALPALIGSYYVFVFALPPTAKITVK